MRSIIITQPEHMPAKHLYAQGKWMDKGMPAVTGREDRLLHPARRKAYP